MEGISKELRNGTIGLKAHKNTKFGGMFKLYETGNCLSVFSSSWFDTFEYKVHVKPFRSSLSKTKNGGK